MFWGSEVVLSAEAVSRGSTHDVDLVRATRDLVDTWSSMNDAFRRICCADDVTELELG